MAARTTFLLALLAGAALVALFFLPWLSVRVAGQEVATATGRQIADGGLTAKALGTAEEAAAPRWWAWGAVGGAALVLAAAVAGVGGIVRRRTAGGGLLSASLVGEGAVLLVLTIRYLDSPFASTRPMEAWWASAVLFGFTALCGLFVVAVSFAAGSRRVRKGRSR
jgi:hypothetical protein